MDPATLKKLNIERRERRACVLVTDLIDGRDRIVRDRDVGEIPGDLGVQIGRVLHSRKSGQVTIDGRAFFLNVFVPPIRIVAIGAVHITQALLPIADTAGFDLEIIDPRQAFASQARFKNTPIAVEWPAAAFAKKPLDRFCAVVALTHDPKIDDEALIEALQAQCIYIGALGSKRSHAKRLERLTALGISKQNAERINGPIGLDIGAANPAEIAVSIMAQIIETLRYTDESGS